ncbi:alpha-methylacyl-CoA racemase [Basidiobolus meristosporus CBS 931.73]|uniref:Alpha-methylacyl-CoA racemase n=1 Tax=Basidiobolus meristosporus CBS 931.73 TaxID=1314790 RepID=A0A1Y1YCQ4_9FUNG|nr:alpha-methylacyl-CoA racemase [Basidiobolus meristosporus CBS 931.73]|eukprot:ORX95821.1 alpha-methylacyl-CoA racemase [Basidiobolus meristosporus CBS 931.73]
MKPLSTCYSFSKMALPLKGIRVVEFAGLAPGPFAGLILADFGAEVIRVDRVNGNSTDLLTRGKRSIALDLKSAEGKEIIFRLVQQADILIDPFRPGVLEKLGFGPEVLCVKNSSLIYARLTGYGQTGSLSKEAGHDINYLAIAGALSVLGRSGEKPMFPINYLADFAGGSLICVVGIMLALYERERSGLGQVIDAAMVGGVRYLSTFLSGLISNGAHSSNRGNNMLDGGAPFYEVYETSDGKYMAVGAIEAQFYHELIIGLELEPNSLPDQYDTSSWPKTRQIFQQRFLQKSQDEWTQIFTNRDACVTPVLPFEHSMDPPPAPILSRTPGKMQPQAQHTFLPPGKHTTQILNEIGYNQAEITKLEQDQVVQAEKQTHKL